jgi:Rieske Fe-S protein
MNRRAFTKTCLMCMTASAVAPVLSSCQATHYVTGTVDGTNIAVSKSEFSYMKKDQAVLRDFIIVRNEKIEFPIYVYRFSDTEYTALLMKCTHQGNELQASGDYLHCSAHGSEFNNRGQVAQGPADKNLRTFPVTSSNDKILIDLRA